MRYKFLFLIFGCVGVSACHRNCPLPPDTTPDDPCYYEYQPTPDAKNVSLSPYFYWCEDPEAVKYRFWLDGIDEHCRTVDTIVFRNEFKPPVLFPNTSLLITYLLSHREYQWKVWAIKASGEEVLISDNTFTTKDERTELSGTYHVQKWCFGPQFVSVNPFVGWTDIKISAAGGDSLKVTEPSTGLTQVYEANENNCTPYDYVIDKSGAYIYEVARFNINGRDTFQIYIYTEPDLTSSSGYVFYGSTK